MAIGHKGSRRIIVDGKSYRWAVPKGEFYNRLQGVALTFSVELDNHKRGAVLRVEIPSTGDDLQSKISITPSLVAKVISEAVARGWIPESSGSAFHISWQIPHLIAKS